MVENVAAADDRGRCTYANPLRQNGGQRRTTCVLTRDRRQCAYYRGRKLRRRLYTRAYGGRSVAGRVGMFPEFSDLPHRCVLRRLSPERRTKIKIERKKTITCRAEQRATYTLYDDSRKKIVGKNTFPRIFRSCLCFVSIISNVKR